MQKRSFFLAASLPNKAFVSPTIESTRRTFAAGLVQENLHFCMRYFSKMKNKTAEKITEQRFPVQSKLTSKNLAYLEVKKKRPKESLTLFMQATLHLKQNFLTTTVLTFLSLH